MNHTLAPNPPLANRMDAILTKCIKFCIIYNINLSQIYTERWKSVSMADPDPAGRLPFRPIEVFLE